MRREDFGFVVSRVMAVIVLVHAADLLASIPALLSLSSQPVPGIDPTTQKADYVGQAIMRGALIGALGVVAVGLWFGAASFGRTAGRERTESGAGFDERALRRVLLSALGLYFLVVGVASAFGIVADAQYLPKVLRDVMSLTAEPRLLAHVLQATLGAVVLTLNSRPIAPRPAPLASEDQR